MTLTLLEIKAIVDQLAEKIGAAQDLLPTYGYSADFAQPHIEVDPSGYAFVVVERGNELERFHTTDLDELLYKIFECACFSMACDYELHHRMAGQDCRRIIFAHEVELLSNLSPRWGEQKTLENEQTLKKYPFDD